MNLPSTLYFKNSFIKTFNFREFQTIITEKEFLLLAAKNGKREKKQIM